MANKQPIQKRDYKEWLEFCDQVQASSGKPINESKRQQKERIQKALKDYQYFFETYLSILADSKCAKFQIKAANAVAKDKNIIAILEWAREHAKSVHSNIGIPMWLIAKGEITGMVLVGKNETDAINLLSDLQAQLQYNELFAHDFGDQYNFGNWEEGNFTTRDGSKFIALGRKQSPRGIRKMAKRPNLAVIDDIDDDEIVENPRRVSKVVKNIMGALYFALSTKGGRMIVAGNRIHQNSILANIVGDVKPGDPKREGIWHSKVCAIENGKPAWPERYSLAELNLKIQRAGILARKEFFHEHTTEGTIFKDKYFQYKKLPPLNHYKMIVGYFDPSFENTSKSDFKAVSIWGIWKDELHCIKRFTRQCDLMEAFLWMYQIEELMPDTAAVIWYMEKQWITQPINFALDEARRQKGGKILPITPDTRQKPNKYTRIVRMESLYVAGTVYYNVKEKHNNDMITGNNHVKGIEPGYNTPDDAPDADEGAWYYLLPHMPSQQTAPIIRKRKHGRW